MTKKKVENLREENNLLTRILESIQDDSKSNEIAKRSVTISSLFAFVAIVAVLAAFNANNKAKGLEVRLETEYQRASNEFATELRRSDEKWAVEYRQLSTNYRLAVMEIDAYNIALAKAGIEVDHSGHSHNEGKP